VLTPEGLRIHRAWRAQPSDVGRWRGSPEEAARTLRTLIEDAVDCRLPESGPVAAHLSGGLDSSAIAAIAARKLDHRGGALHAYSLLPGSSAGELLDERPFIEDVLRQNPGIRWTPVNLAPLHREGIFEPDFPLAPVLDQPDQEICASAQAAGISYIMAGTGGDLCATFHGHGIQAELLRKHLWVSLWTQMNGTAAYTGRSLARIALGEFLSPLVPGWLWALRRERRGLSKPGDRRRNAVSFLQPALAAQVMDSLPRPTPRSSPEGRIEMLEEGEIADRGWQWSMIGSRHGIAYTYPLADRRILDFILSLPIDRLVDGGFSRQPFRNAMEGILPESIRWRRTKFLPFPDVSSNLMTAAPLVLPRVNSIRHCSVARDIFDIDAIQRALTTAAGITAAEAVTRSPEGQVVPRRPLRMAMHALRALVLAEYVGRMGNSCG
jgi:asparagine synthase (glutamine-hydrolysing)